MNKRSFTLIELIVVIIILSLLAAAVFPIISTVNQGAEVSRIRSDMEAIKTAAYKFHADTGLWPINECLDDPNEWWSPNYLGFYPGWSGPYLDKIPRAPCGGWYCIELIGGGAGQQIAVTNSCPGTYDPLIIHQ